MFNIVSFLLSVLSLNALSLKAINFNNYTVVSITPDCIQSTIDYQYNFIPNCSTQSGTYYYYYINGIFKYSKYCLKSNC